MRMLNKFCENGIISDELFDFANLYPWYEKLNLLSKLALEEDWRFKKEDAERKNKDTPILENYILHTYRKLAHDYNHASTQEEKDSVIYITESYDKMCFNTGLYTKQYQEIYACFEKYSGDRSLVWHLKGFSDTGDPFFFINHQAT